MLLLYILDIMTNLYIKSRKMGRMVSPVIVLRYKGFGFYVLKILELQLSLIIYRNVETSSLLNYIFKKIQKSHQILTKYFDFTCYFSSNYIMGR
jgi:hypothetical protein